MTRKDFVLIANALRESAEQGGVQESAMPPTTQRGQYLLTVMNVAKALATTNPAFNRDRFLKACGVQS